MTEPVDISEVPSPHTGVLTPLDRVHVEAVRVVREAEQSARREGTNMPTSEDEAWALKRRLESWRDPDGDGYPYDKIDIETCRAAVWLVARTLGYAYWGRDFSGVNYAETHTMRVAVEVEINVGEYLLSRAEVVTDPQRRRHVLDDLPPQARDEVRRHLGNLRYVDSVRYVEPRVELRWDTAR